VSSFGQRTLRTRIIAMKTGNAIAKRKAVAANGGKPPAIALLTTTVLPTPIIASAQKE
jgi:hypothetical protein